MAGVVRGKGGVSGEWGKGGGEVEGKGEDSGEWGKGAGSVLLESIMVYSRMSRQLRCKLVTQSQLVTWDCYAFLHSFIQSQRHGF